MNRFIRNVVVGVSSAAIMFTSYVPAFADMPFCWPTVIHFKKNSFYKSNHLYTI